ncbi:MAG: OmpA family protein [Porticoccaceae bacterium]
MRNSIILSALMISSLALFGCASQPNSNLEEARTTFTSLQNNPQARQLAPLETKDAEEALKRADKAAQGGANKDELDHLAYLTKQRVALANQTIALKEGERQFKEVSGQRNQTRLEARDMQLKEREQLLREREDQIRQLEEELNAKPTDRGSVVTFGDVLFDLNKADLKPAAAANIQRLAAFLKENPERQILIEGFTDSTGSDSYNLALSQQRADSVRHALVREGVEQSRITAQGLGKAHPVSDNDTPASRAMNRRVEVTIANDDKPVPARR